MKNVIILLLTLFSVQLIGQPVEFNGAPAPNNEKYGTIDLGNFPLPEVGTPDWLVAVDADDATVLLGLGQSGANSASLNVGGWYVNEPTGASNQFHLILWDASEGTFHILYDVSGEPLTIDWVDSAVEGGQVAGYENASLSLTLLLSALSRHGLSQ